MAKASVLGDPWIDDSALSLRQKGAGFLERLPEPEHAMPILDGGPNVARCIIRRSSNRPLHRDYLQRGAVHG